MKYEKIASASADAKTWRATFPSLRELENIRRINHSLRGE